MDIGLITWLIDKAPPAYRLLKSLKNPIPSKHWIPRLNDYFEDTVKIYGVYENKPTIKSFGKYPLTPEQKKLAKIERKNISVGEKPNDPHAILAKIPNLNDDPVQFCVKTLDFAEVRALRKFEQKPEILSANILFFCKESDELILHRRADDSDTYPKFLHTFGGAYMPPEGFNRNVDKYNLRNTAIREVFEESNASLDFDEKIPMMLSKELETGFIQLGFLGVNITLKQRNELEANPEGSIVFVKFAELKERLLTGKSWVPTGKAQILAWLALGAPNTKWRAKFSGLSPTALFNEIVA
jgi:hypothetical protein